VERFTREAAADYQGASHRAKAKGYDADRGGDSRSKGKLTLDFVEVYHDSKKNYL